MDKYTYGAVIVSRNDNYGGDLPERATYAFNSILSSVDELIYVDWASEGRTLIDEIQSNLVHLEKLKVVVVSPQKASIYVAASPNPQKIVPQVVTEVFGRNIGLRRLTTDFMISTNVDVIFPPRYLLEKLAEPVGTMSPVAKRMISLAHVRNCGGILDDVQGELVHRVETNGEPFCIPGFGPQGPVAVCAGDVWSLVNGNGDFQIAPRDIWYDIRGFEESLIGRGYADGNVQKKAMMKGWKIAGRWDVPVFHIGHDGGSRGGGGGYGGWNDVVFALKDFQNMTNPETWGFSDDKDLEVKTL